MSNLQIFKVFFRYELWSNDFSFQNLIYRFTSNLNVFFVELNIKEEIESRIDKIKRIIDEFLERFTCSIFKEEKAIDIILQQLIDLAIVKTLEIICRFELN